MRKSTRSGLAIAFTAALISAAPAVADPPAKGGYKTAPDLTVVTGSGAHPDLFIVSGSMAAVRSDNGPSIKDIGCKLYPSDEGLITYCFAHAPGAAQVDIHCTSSREEFASAVAAINGDSFIEYSVYLNANNTGDEDVGECVSLMIENSSKYGPKVQL